jgi:ATP-dependent DNA helicase RecG
MTSVQQLQGVGAAAASLLEKLHIFSTDDLLFHLPRDYEDRSTIIPMNQLVVGRSYLLEGEVKSIDFPPGKRNPLLRCYKMILAKSPYAFIIFIKV